MDTLKLMEKLSYRFGSYPDKLEEDMYIFLDRFTDQERDMIFENIKLNWRWKRAPIEADINKIWKEYRKKNKKKIITCQACGLVRFNGKNCWACFYNRHDNINEYKSFLQMYCRYDKYKKRFFYNELGKNMAKNEMLKFKELLKKIEIKNRKIKEDLERDKIAQENKMKILAQEKALT